MIAATCRPCEASTPAQIQILDFESWTSVWLEVAACMSTLPNSELVERAHGVWSSWAVLVPSSMMNRRLISLVYESTAPPNDAHTRCFYLKSYLGYIRSFDWWQTASMQTPNMSEFLLSCSWILSFPRDSVCMWPICRSASGQIIQWIRGKVKRLQGILVMLRWEC